MPKYIVNDKVYNIPDDKVKGFESKYPDARVVYYNEGKTYKLPLGKRDGFLKQYPSASLEMPAGNAATPSQPTEQPSVVPSPAAPSTAVDAYILYGNTIMMSFQSHIAIIHDRNRLAFFHYKTTYR